MPLRREDRPEKQREYDRRYRETSQDKIRQYAGQPNARELARERSRRYREANRDKTRAAIAVSEAKVRRIVFDHYGWACACCGATEDLGIDHMNGNGTEHRMELFGDAHAGGTQFYRWLIRQGLPGGYQTLCKPCNRSKARGECCRLAHGGE